VSLAWSGRRITQGQRVTARRAPELANRKFVPKQQIIEHYASQYGWDPTKLASVLSEFGQLPDRGQEQLIRCLVLGFGRYQMLANRVGRMTSSQLRIRLATVEATAKKLLHQFGIKPDHPSAEPLRSLGKPSPDWRIVTMQLAIAGTDTKDKDSVAVNAELAAVNDQVANSVIGVLDLYRRAKSARQATTKHIAPGHGGHRHRPNPRGQLIRDAIAIYEHIRNQHPDSGNKPGYGGPLLRFIYAVADLYGTGVRDADVRDAWRTRKSKRK
jgi:hypothetical protein